MTFPSFAARRVILTYGRFDLFDQDHAQFLRDLRAMGDELIVGCSSDALALSHGLPCQMPYDARAAMLSHCRFVDRVIAQTHDAQMRTDIVNYNVSSLVMGTEDAGRFDMLQDIADVRHVPRRRATTRAIDWTPQSRLSIPA